MNQFWPEVHTTSLILNIDTMIWKYIKDQFAFAFKLQLRLYNRFALTELSIFFITKGN